MCWSATHHPPDDNDTHGGAGGERGHIGDHGHHQVFLAHQGRLIVGRGCNGAGSWRRCGGHQCWPGGLSGEKHNLVWFLFLSPAAATTKTKHFSSSTESQPEPLPTWRLWSISFRALCALTVPRKRCTSADQPSENWNSMFSWKSLQSEAQLRS